MNANQIPSQADMMAMIDALSRRLALVERICLPDVHDDAEPPAAAPARPSTGLVFRSVIQTVAEANDIQPAQIMDMARRDRHTCRARFAVWQALNEAHGWSQSKIARRFDCDHTTVLNGLRQARKLWGAK